MFIEAVVLENVFAEGCRLVGVFYTTLFRAIVSEQLDD
jgi:hypothetical protein